MQDWIQSVNLVNYERGETSSFFYQDILAHHSDAERINQLFPLSTDYVKHGIDDNGHNQF